MLLQRIAELVGERAELVWRGTVRALGVLAHFVGLAHLLNRGHAEPDPASRGIGIEHHDLNLVADAERLLHVRFSRNTAFTQGNEAFDPRLELDERAELRNPCHATPA